MTMTLFDQNRAVENYGKEREVKGAVEMCQDLGTSFTDTIRMIAQKFGFTANESENQVKTYWKGKLPTV